MNTTTELRGAKVPDSSLLDDSPEPHPAQIAASYLARCAVRIEAQGTRQAREIGSELRAIVGRIENLKDGHIKALPEYDSHDGLGDISACLDMLHKMRTYAATEIEKYLMPYRDEIKEIASLRESRAM